MDVIKKIFKNVLIRHFLLWCLFVILSAILYTQSGDDFLRETKAHIFYLPFYMTATYLTVYFLIPVYLLKQKYFMFFIFLITSALVISIVERTANYYYLLPKEYPEYVATFKIFSYRIFFTAINIYFVVLIASTGKLFGYWYKNQKDKQELAKEKLKAELNFLKAQIHPHFLFNTLNNLYVLSRKKPEEASELIMRLSEILRFLLYECDSEYIPVEKEIEIIKNYIELEKIRYGDSLSVEFQTAGSFINKKIAPVMLLPFVENTFKHGVSNKIDNKWIRIFINITNDEIRCIFENSKETTQSEDEMNYKEGIGLNNVRRRLDIIYGSKHKLIINNNTDTFKTILEIKLN